MIRHVVFFKLQDNSESNKELIKEKILSMKGKIDLLKHIEVGINFSAEQRAYDLVLISDFDSKEDLKSYAVHPIHVSVINFLKAANTQTKVVDYEF